MVSPGKKFWILAGARGNVVCYSLPLIVFETIPPVSIHYRGPMGRSHLLILLAGNITGDNMRAVIGAWFFLECNQVGLWLGYSYDTA